MQAQPIPFLDLLNGDVQYVVPRWQRRYCWGQDDIQRLVEDLVTIASSEADFLHYGGTLLTLRETATAGVVTVYRLVDGQQRLTTVSILLACIADVLEENARVGDWTSERIINNRLTNPGEPSQKFRKLKLQPGDDEEYQSGLSGKPNGAGAVAQAWRIARRLVARNNIQDLLTGLERLQVVSIGLNQSDDPQQIFESINATGRPLTESEKVKNWLLIGLPTSVQMDLYDNCWLEIERLLGATHDSAPIDLFLRDFLRWKTGDLKGLSRVYEDFRRWAIRSNRVHDRPELCRELTKLARLYGEITGQSESSRSVKVKTELRHLRSMNIDVHRPFTMRLLHDADRWRGNEGVENEIARTLSSISTWISRLWLAGKRLNAMNRAFTDLAHLTGPLTHDASSEYWIQRICELRNTSVSVPSDEEVAEGIRNRPAYGGSATQSTFAVLCALMYKEHKEESPNPDRLTVEHVMPQSLTDEWREDLGEEASEIHAQYRDLLGNLTLSGDATNSGLGTKTFTEKKRIYCLSPIGLTRRIADESRWGVSEIERRTEYLINQALELWPWEDRSAPKDRRTGGDTYPLRWRIANGPWQSETTASQMTLNVVSALLSLDEHNVNRLSGKLKMPNVHPITEVAPDSSMRVIPNHENFTMYPYAQNYESSAARCRKFGERCNVSVDVEFVDTGSSIKRFWRFLKDSTSGLPGQKDSWQGANQWSRNTNGDYVGVFAGPEQVSLYIKSEVSEVSVYRIAQMRRYSWLLRENMSDQEFVGDSEKEAHAGRSISIVKAWNREEEQDWHEVAVWIKEQCERLHSIIQETALERQST